MACQSAKYLSAGAAALVTRLGVRLTELRTIGGIVGRDRLIQMIIDSRFICMSIMSIRGLSLFRLILVSDQNTLRSRCADSAHPLLPLKLKPEVHGVKTKSSCLNRAQSSHRYIA